MKKLFGNNIKPSCEYCEMSSFFEGNIVCNKNKEIANGKCRSFEYAPLKRVPKSTPVLQQFSPEDFTL